MIAAVATAGARWQARRTLCRLRRRLSPVTAATAAAAVDAAAAAAAADAAAVAALSLFVAVVAADAQRGCRTRLHLHRRRRLCIRCKANIFIVVCVVHIGVSSVRACNLCVKRRLHRTRLLDTAATATAATAATATATAGVATAPPVRSQLSFSAPRRQPL
jgi:hypothetical protein